MRSRRGKIEQLAEEGESGAEAVVEQLDKIDESLSACQVGITMASIGIGFLGEPSLAKLIEPVFGGLSHGAAVGISVAIAFALVTALHISVGEQVPKMLAISQRRAHRAPRLAAAELVPRGHRAVRRIGAERDLERDRPPLRRRPERPRRAPHRRGPEADHRQLRAAAATLDPGEAGMLGGVFHLHEQEAREVMTPIPAVVTVDASETRRGRRCAAASPPATPAWS